MNVFILGITGKIGRLLVDKLLSAGDEVCGLVRRPEQQGDLTPLGVRTVIGDLAEMSEETLAKAIGDDVDVIVFTAGSNGGPTAVTTAIDGEGVSKAMDAANHAGVTRFALVSVLPESWRERILDEKMEYYFAVKKRAEVHLTKSGLDWLILRPSLLVDEPVSGTVSLGPAELHDEIARADVAETLVELLHEPLMRRRVLEVNKGWTPIGAAVHALARSLAQG